MKTLSNILLSNTTHVYSKEEIKNITENAKDNNVSIFYLHANMLYPNDFSFPLFDSKSITKIFYADFLTTKNDTIYIVNDINNSMTEVKNIINELISERKIGDFKLPENIRFILN